MERRYRFITLFLMPFLFLLVFDGCGTIKEERKSPQVLYKEGIGKMIPRRSLLFFKTTDYEGSRYAFEEIKNRYSFTSFGPLAEIRLADIHYKKEEYSEAIVAYDGFIKLHPKHEETPYAVYQIGNAYFEQINGVDRDVTAPEGALLNYQLLVDRFPDSKHTKEAEEKIIQCKDLLASYEFYVGSHYFSQKVYEGAAERFKTALERFPGYGPKEKALLYLGKSYIGSNDREEGREALLRLQKAFPGSAEAEEAGIILENI